MLDNEKMECLANPAEGPEVRGGACSNSKSDESDGVVLLTNEELLNCERAALVDQIHALQRAYAQLESDNRFLAWEFKEFQDSLTYFSRAAKLAHQLNAAGLETIAELAVNELPSYFNCRFGALYFYDPDTKLFSLRRSSAPCPESTPLHRERDASHFLIKLFFGNSEPFIAEYDLANRTVIADTDSKVTDFYSPEWYAILGRKAMFLPLSVKQADWDEPLMLGGLLIGDAKDGLEAKDAEITVIFNDLLSSSLYNAMLVQKLNDLTIIDPLTQIFNRRHLINQLTMAMTQARRHGHDLSIAMLDIDYFKRFNDTYGHLCGDDVLKQIAAIMKSAIRANVDIPARYGGEEFLVIMPFANAEQAMVAAERIRYAVENHPFTFEGSSLSITCSLGVAEYIPGETSERFIDRADEALYRAKREGRNRICVADGGIV